MTDAEDVPSLARIYDRLLGGAQNFAPDRERADEVSAVYPRAARWAWANRAFLRHAVDHARDLGVDQFVDLGSGVPAADATHTVARRAGGAASVAYVDHEPVAVARTEALLAGVTGVSVTHADVRDVDAVLAAPGVADLLDLGRPVALLAMAVVHCVADADDPAGILNRYRRALAPGSVLALTHTSGDLPGHPELARAHREALALYASTNNPLYGRTRAEIRGLVEAAGFTVDTDGLVELSHWAPPEHRHEPLGGYALISEPL